MWSSDDEDLRSESAEPPDYSEKNDLKDFIVLYESCPSLWNTNNKQYLDSVKKNAELDKLLQIYKKIKPNATKNDVKKKINSLRSNFRKELKKIETSKRSGCGTEDVYKPTSSTFHLLKFLTTIEKPKLRKNDGESNENSRTEEENSLVISSISKKLPPPAKIRKFSGSLATQNELLNRACSLLSEPSVSSSQDLNPLAAVWSEKLKSLQSTQKLYAEKAINDILFEAQLGNLHRSSIQINTISSNLSVSQSTPSPTEYSYTPSSDIALPGTLNYDNSNYTPGTSTTYPPVSQENNITKSQYTAYPPVLHLPDDSGSMVTSQEPESSIRVQDRRNPQQNKHIYITKIQGQHDSGSTVTSQEPESSIRVQDRRNPQQNKHIYITKIQGQHDSGSTVTSQEPESSIRVQDRRNPQQNKHIYITKIQGQHDSGSTVTSQEPESSIRVQDRRNPQQNKHKNIHITKIQGQASEIILQRNPRTSDSEDYSVGSLFATLNPN